MYYTDNPAADFSKHDAAQQRELDKRPICGYCWERIQDEELYVINGEYICESCMEDFKKRTEDYIE